MGPANTVSPPQITRATKLNLPVSLHRGTAPASLASSKDRMVSYGYISSCRDGMGCKTSASGACPLHLTLLCRCLATPLHAAEAGLLLKNPAGTWARASEQQSLSDRDPAAPPTHSGWQP
eukprot:1107703-Rhodomonas_salina.2